MADSSVIENSILNLIEYRLRGRPTVKTFEELDLGNSSLREIAPYALKIRQNAVIPTQQFFNYAAVVATVDGSFACIIFELVNAEEIIAYAGHFITDKDFIFDPNTREPVASDFSLLDAAKNHMHLSLFGTANPNLLLYPDYFLYRNNVSYQELILRTQDMFIMNIQQQQQSNAASVANPNGQIIYLLREPLTTNFYTGTALPISNKSVERITQTIQPMGSVKRIYGELGSFHSQIYAHGQPKVKEDPIKFNLVDDVDGHTTYYSAYEEPGLMSFYFTSFLLGSLRGRHVVGIVVGDSFFVMATNRVYNRYSPGIQISPENLDATEVMEKIHLPSYLPLHLVVTMLELRQILSHPFMFPDEMEAITKSFGFEGDDENAANLCLTFIRQLGPKRMMERMQRIWVQQMLDIHYTQSFQNSLCEYGESTVDSENPSLFCLNIVRLWVKELLRIIYCDKRPKDDCKLSDFFRMTISDFIQQYLSLFGLSPESCFTCHHLGVDGITTSLCQTSIAAKDIGKHVDNQHTSQMLIQGHFKPFSLSLASKFVSLTNQTDVTPLEKCKSTVAEFRGISYMEVLRKIDGTTSSSPPPTPPPVPVPMPLPAVPDRENKIRKRSKSRKSRKRRSMEEKLVSKVLRERQLGESFKFSSSSDDSQQTDFRLSPHSTRMTRSSTRVTLH